MQLKPQIYVYVDSEGNGDFYVTRGEIDVIELNWETIKNASDNLLEAGDFLEARAKLKRIAKPGLRKAELEGLRDFLHEYNRGRHEYDQWKSEQRNHRIEEARQVLREAGELS